MPHDRWFSGDVPQKLGGPGPETAKQPKHAEHTLPAANYS